MNRENEDSEKFDLSIAATANEVFEFLTKNHPHSRLRLANFIHAFDEEFPKGSDMEAAARRAKGEACVWALLGGPLTLYSVNMNGPAIVDLHGILERFVIREICDYLATSRERFRVLCQLIERMTLPDLAEIMLDLRIWDKEDVQFAKKLNVLRNGAAHKNPRTVSNAVCSGKKIHMLDVDSVMASVDCISLLMGTIRLLLKMFEYRMRMRKPEKRLTKK